MSVLNTCAIQEADTVVTFWRDAGPKRWFAKNTMFDEEFRCRFIHLYDAARQGKLDDWLTHATG
jgi:uncharacterized protein (DUF924 family)